jgi:beta-aspartyl-dipeptidase (metallo-type)
MITLIKNVNAFAPEPLGEVDILIADGRIAAIQSDIDVRGEHIHVIEGRGRIAIPGLVDTLVHFSGGGGEGGFHTRTPQMQLSDAIIGGVTTVIGALGTDATTRSHTDLLAKAHALQFEGLSTYCYTGSYQVPARTVTGSITDDIILIDKFIGIGEVAISDHRGSQISTAELARIGGEARVGGMLSGTAGIVSIHVGDSESQLQPLHQVLATSDIPATQYYPTHINRNQPLLEAGVAWTKAGGFIDMTTSTNQQFIDEGEIPAAAAIAYCLSQGVPASQLTMSSDGNASLPVFDDSGNLTGLEVGRVSSLFDSFVELVQDHKVVMEEAIQVVSTTPASILKLMKKGKLKADYDADIVLLSPDDLGLSTVYCRGKVMLEEGKLKAKGTFE